MSHQQETFQSELSDLLAAAECFTGATEKSSSGSPPIQPSTFSWQKTGRKRAAEPDFGSQLHKHDAAMGEIIRTSWLLSQQQGKKRSSPEQSSSGSFTPLSVAGCSFQISPYSGAPPYPVRQHSTSPTGNILKQYTAELLTRSNSLPDILYKEFTPVITPDFNGETYRFWCSSPGLYLCSVTGLVFDMKGEGDVVYRIVPWNWRLLVQHHKKPAGPLFDIKCVQQCVSQLHLPHCEISSTGGGRFLSVAHVADDGDVEFIRPQKITETHVVINITGFSAYGNVKDEDSPPDPVRALILSFYRPPADPDADVTSFLNVLLLPGNVVLQDVQHTRKKYIGYEMFIDVSSDCKLKPDQFYTLITSAQDDSVTILTRKLQFHGEFHSNYYTSFHVILKTMTPHIKLHLTDTNSSFVVWTGEVHLPPVKEIKSCEQLSPNLTLYNKLIRIRRSFIDAMSEPVFNSVLDKLLEKKVITESEKESVDKLENKRDKARFVFDTVSKKGEAARSEMFHLFNEMNVSKHITEIQDPDLRPLMQDYSHRSVELKTQMQNTSFKLNKSKGSADKLVLDPQLCKDYDIKQNKQQEEEKTTESKERVEPDGDGECSGETEPQTITEHFSSTNTLSPHSHLQLFSKDSCVTRKTLFLSRCHSMSSLSKIPPTKNKLTRSNSLPDILYKEFTPVIIADFDDDTYWFQCSSPGLYLCSVTGVMFDMKGEGDVVYRIVPWNRRLLVQHHKKPAGPLFDIKCVQQCVSQLHLPHCEISSTGGGRFLSVVHVTDDGDVEFIRPQKITETHVVINITGFSGYGNVKDEDSPPDPVRALVLLFYKPPINYIQRSVLNVLLVPGNIVVWDVYWTRKKLVGDETYIETSSDCKLKPDQFYTLSTCPQDDFIKVQPKKAEFVSENYNNYIPSFQVFLKTVITDIELFLRDTNSSLVVWESEVYLPSANERSSQQCSLSLPPDERLLSVQSSFIEKISEPNLKSLLDKLLEKKVLSDSERESVNAERTRGDKARVLIDTVTMKGEAASSEMIKFLCELDPYVCKEIGLM